jgi:putative membrane protein
MRAKEKPMYRPIVLIGGLLMLHGIAAARIGNPAGMGVDMRMSKPGVPAPDQTNNQDRLFAQLATAGGLAETEFGKMTAGKAKTDVVRQFASMMIRDHDDAKAKLKTLVGDARIPIPTALDPDHQAVRDQLAKLSGAAFDEAYIKAQIVEHQKTAQLLAWEISMGEDAKLQQFAAAMLPIVLDHLQRAQQINGSLTGSAVRTLLPTVAVNESKP